MEYLLYVYQLSCDTCWQHVTVWLLQFVLTDIHISVFMFYLHSHPFVTAVCMNSASFMYRNIMQVQKYPVVSMRLELDCICGAVFWFFVGRVPNDTSLCEMIIFMVFCLGKVLFNIYQQNIEKQQLIPVFTTSYLVHTSRRISLKHCFDLFYISIT